MTRLKTIALFFLFLSHLSILSIKGQTVFTAEAPQIVEGTERFNIQFVLQNAKGQNFVPPSFKDFEVLSGPNISHSQSVQVMNTHVSSASSEIYSYILSPKRNGSFTIGAAKITAKGKIMKTTPLSIRVVKNNRVARNTTRSISPSKAFDTKRSSRMIGEKDLFFTVNASKNKVYEQEPIMLTYRFHTRVGIGLANVMLAQKPDLKGFWTQEIKLPRNLSPEAKVINGEVYRVGTNLQYLIFPQQTGKFLIPGVVFDCEVIRRNSEENEYDAFFEGALDLQRKTRDLTIQVLPLPSPRPARFSGGVGKMSVEGKILSKLLKTNDVATFRFTIKGVGNLKLIKAPQISFPKEFDQYAPKINDQTQVTADGVNGAIHFDYTFVPRKAGQFIIPAVEFVYFDTSLQKYVTHRTRQISLDIRQGNRLKNHGEAVDFSGEDDIRDIRKGKNEPFEEGGWNWWGTIEYFLALFTFSIGGLALIKYSPKMFAFLREVNIKRLRAADVARKKINVLNLSDLHETQFFDAMNDVVLTYFAVKLNFPKTKLSKLSVLDELQNKKVSSATIKMVETLLNDMDFARFTPSNDMTFRENLLRRVQKMIDMIENELKQKCISEF